VIGEADAHPPVTPTAADPGRSGWPNLEAPMAPTPLGPAAQPG